MHATVKRLTTLGALAAAFGVAAPVTSAGAAPVGPTLPADFPAVAAGPYLDVPGVIPFGIGPMPGMVGQVIVGPSVVGPVVTTTAPSSFINANNQDSVGGNVSGVQISGL
jgi:hypothetical protein